MKNRAFLMLLFCSLSILGQHQYDENIDIANMATGVYYQKGPGSNNTLNWTYPYGTKLSVVGAAHRNFELITDKYPNGQLKIRQWDNPNDMWSDWRGIPVQNENGIYMVPDQFGVGILGEARGNTQLHLSRGSEGKDRALISFGDDGTYTWHTGLLYGGGWLTPDFHISTKASFRSGGVIVHEPEFTIMRNGDVGIGTRVPDAKLAVKGDIHAQEVKVDLNGAVAPDYVFYDDYYLRSLEEVQNYIKEHGHLPNVPSAKEMELNGIQLGEMNMKLLEKIEELTLYIIEQKKELNGKNAVVAELKQKVKILDAQVSKILVQLKTMKK